MIIEPFRVGPFGGTHLGKGVPEINQKLNRVRSAVQLTAEEIKLAIFVTYLVFNSNEHFETFQNSLASCLFHRDESVHRDRQTFPRPSLRKFFLNFWLAIGVESREKENNWEIKGGSIQM